MNTTLSNLKIQQANKINIIIGSKHHLPLASSQASWSKKKIIGNSDIWNNMAAGITLKGIKKRTTFLAGQHSKPRLADP